MNVRGGLARPLFERVRARHIALLLAVSLGALVQAQTPQLRVVRPVTATVSGPQRLAIDVPLLAGGAPFALAGSRTRPVAVSGLSDLRFFDAAGSGVPYLLVYSPTAEPAWRRGAILPVAATKKTSGFEADFGNPFTMDLVRLGGLPTPFLKRLVLEGSGDRQHWTLLAGEATLFDLPAEQLRQTALPFAPGSYRYVRVTWDDTNSGRVPPPLLVEARQVGAVAAPPPLTAPLAVERRPSEPGRSRYRMKLPAARLPIAAVDLQVDGGHVFREAVVFQSRLTTIEAAPAEVGRARLRRVVRDGVSAEALRIPVTGITESELDLVIEDGANPPLAVNGATAVFAELPWIYLEARAGSLTAQYGNAALRPPSYDLEAVRDRVVVTGLPDATWGDPRPASGATTGVTPSPLPETGATVDSSGFRHVRALPAGDAQLVALVLDAAALAHSGGPAGSRAAAVSAPGRFADVRILDVQHRQVPYLVERRDEPMPIDLTIAPGPSEDPALQAATGRSWSSYRIALPYDGLPSGRLVIETSARVFHRTVRLLAERPADRERRDRWYQVLASQAWTHASQLDAAPALTLPLPERPDTTLVLSVDEGDNQPLPLTSARLLLPSYRLRFYRPAGAPLRLAYGHRELAAPRYDLALLAPHVMGVDAREILAAPEIAPRSAAPSFITPRMFWILLAAAVVALLALVARLVSST
jgi:hypothetical protein